MKKSFVRIALICALACATPISFVSCKDYDSDVERFDTKNSEFGKQLTTLETALTATKSELEAAKNSAASAIAAAKAAQETGDAALASANAAAAAAELAKQAAATAKIEAIEEAIAQVKVLLQEYATKNEVDDALLAHEKAVAEQIEGIQKGLSADLKSVQAKVDDLQGNLDAAKTQIGKDIESLQAEYTAALEIQKKAFEEYQKLVDEKLSSLDSKLTAEIKAQTSALQTQIDAVKKALEEAASKKDLTALETAMKKYVDDAVAALNTKLTEYKATMDQLSTQVQSLASKAALEALKTSMEDKIKTEVATLNGKLTTLENLINSVKTQVGTNTEAIATNAAALETFKTAMSGITDGINGRLSNLETDVAGIKESIIGIKTDISNNKAAITALESQILADATNLNTLLNSLVKRLSSITFVPEFYCDGVPAVRFITAEYTPKELNDKYELVDAKNAKLTLIDGDGTTTAKFRLNPSSVRSTEIGVPYFMCDEAQNISRASNSINDPVKFTKGYFLDNGIFEVVMNKAVDANINNAANGKFNIASLVIPLAESVMTTEEKEAGAEISVASSYISIVEKTLAPQIAKDDANVKNGEALANRFYDNAEAYTTSNKENLTIESEAATNILDYVTGCYDNDLKKFDKASLAKYGLTLEASVDAKHEYVVNGVNQQTAITVTKEGAITIPKGRGAEGMTPIITVTLKHGTEIVDVRFIKVKIVRNNTVVKIDVKDFGTLNFFDLKTLNVTLKEMTDKVLDDTRIKMTRAEFNSRYAIDTKVGKGTISYLDADADNTFAWSFTQAQIGLIDLATLSSEQLTQTITFKDPNEIYPTVVLTFKVKYAINEADKAHMNIINPTNWISPNKVMRVFPTPPSSGTCVYDTDLWLYFMNNGKSPVIMNDGAEGWDVQMVTKKDDGYTASNGGYTLSDKAGKALDLTWNTGHTQWIGTTCTSTNAVLANNASGIALLNRKDATDPKTVTVSFEGSYNEKNRVKVAQYELQFVTPIYFNTLNKAAQFTDKGKTAPSTISNANLYEIKDNYNNVVTMANLGSSFYGITEIKWDVDNAIAGIDANGQIDDNLSYKEGTNAKLWSIELTQSGETLTFTNNTSPTEKAYNLFVPITVTHKWGVEKDYIKIRVVPGI